jgi:hypothetical protein
MLREPNTNYLKNTEQLEKVIGNNGSHILLNAIKTCYETLDVIDETLNKKGLPVISQLVELNNFSGMIGNILGGGFAESSEGIYERNKPHAYPDLLSRGNGDNKDLELKMALEQNSPKGHHPKDGYYIFFRYILADKEGVYKKGRDNRGDTVWIWEVRIGYLKEEDFKLSDTSGDSGKTAPIRTREIYYKKTALVYYVPEHLPFNESYKYYQDL